MEEQALVVVPETSPRTIEDDISFAKKAASHLMDIVKDCSLAVKIGKEEHIKFEGWSTIASFYGFILGQSKFFIGFVKKTFSRFKRKKK